MFNQFTICQKSLSRSVVLTLQAALISILCFTSASAADIPPAPSLAVKAYLLKDFNSGNVVAQQKADSRIEPASLTKIMTAYLSFKALKKWPLNAYPNTAYQYKSMEN